MARHPTYVFDIDGTVADYRRAHAHLCYALGLDDTSASPTDYRWGPPETWERIGVHLEAHPRWWLTLEPESGLDTNRLREICRDADVLWLTARPVSSKISALWLREKLGILAPHVVSVEDWEDKIYVLRGLKPGLFIDDHTPTIERALREVPEVESILVAQPYNAESWAPRQKINDILRGIG